LPIVPKALKKMGMNAVASSTPMSVIPSDGRVLYFARDRVSFGALSHFHESPIQLDRETWLTVEHYYQAQKSDNPAYQAAIRAAVSPGMAKRLAAPPDASWRGSEQSWFRKNGLLPRAHTPEMKLGIMRRANWAKFSQHAALAELLLSTGGAELVEDSPLEPFWGTGRDGQGLNWAGRLLMEIRAQLRGERSHFDAPA
jgi:N-glycosidase YbiA